MYQYRQLGVGLLAASLLVLLLGCGGETAVSTPTNHATDAEMLTLPELTAAELDGAPLKVVATTSIIGDVVAQVGGKAIDLTTLMGQAKTRTVLNRVRVS